MANFGYTGSLKTIIDGLIASISLSKTTVAITSATTLTANARNTVDGSGAAYAVTLPTPTKVGQKILVERIDTSTTNAITIAAASSAQIRGSGTATIVMPAVGAAFESLMFEAESLTSWAVSAGHKPKAWLDGLYAPLGAGGYQDAATKSNRRLLTTLGDSLTAGNQDGTGISYPAELGIAVGSGVTMNIVGIGGWTSTDLAIKFGAVDVTLGAFTIPTSGAATAPVTAPTGDWRATGTAVTFTWVGQLSTGQTGTLTHNVSTDSSWTFTPTTSPGSAVSIPAGTTFHCTENDTHRGDLVVIWVGKNNESNAAKIQADVAAIVARLTPTVKRYLVLGVTPSSSETTGTSGGTAVAAVNTALAATYGVRFLNIAAYLMSSGLAVNTLTATSADTTAISNGVIPPQLMYSDGVHLNNYGYRAVATAVADALYSLEWAPDARTPIPSIAHPNLMNDPSFESGVSQMSAYSSNLSFAQSTAAAHTGTYGARGTYSGAFTSPVFRVKPTSNVDPTVVHSASIWVRPSIALGMRLLVEGLDGSNASTGSGGGNPLTGCPANTWTQLTTAAGGYAAPSGVATRLAIQTDNTAWASGNTIDFDDAVLVAYTSPN